MIYIYIFYTLIQSVGRHTDEYCTYIWTSLGEFRYERYESVYVTLLTVFISVLLSQYYKFILFTKNKLKSHFRIAKSLLGHATAGHH